MWHSTIAIPAPFDCRMNAASMTPYAFENGPPRSVLSSRFHAVEFVVRVQKLAELTIVSFQQRYSLRAFLAKAQSYSFELVVPLAGTLVCPFDLSTLVLASASAATG
jgi:hypothetical protein